MLRQLNRSYTRGRICGTPKSGVLGSLIPSSGLNGASYLYNDLDLPADAGNEYSGEITTFPLSGSIFAYEDGSFIYDGTPSVFYYQLRENGIAIGEPVVVAVGGVAAASITFAPLTLASTITQTRTAAADFTLGALTVSAAGLRPYLEATVNVTLADMTVQASGSLLGILAAADFTLDDLTVAGTATQGGAVVATTLDDLTLVATAHLGSASVGEAAITFDDIRLDCTGENLPQSGGSTLKLTSFQRQRQRETEFARQYTHLTIKGEAAITLEGMTVKSRARAPLAQKVTTGAAAITLDGLTTTGKAKISKTFRHPDGLMRSTPDPTSLLIAAIQSLGHVISERGRIQ